MGLAFALVGLSVSGPTLARADDKVFAPQSCRAIDSQLGGIGDVLIGAGGLEQNESIDYQLFICPLVRDAVVGQLEDVWVRVNNENSDEDTPPLCCVHAVSLGGSSQDFECQAAQDIDGSASIHFILDDFSEFDYGHYVVSCELGGEDNLISIRTRESS